MAEELRLASIAYPAFGTGVGGFPVRRMRADHGRRWFARTRRRQRASRLVRFVLFGQAAYRAFVEVAGDMLGPPLDGPPDCPIRLRWQTEGLHTAWQT